MSIWTEKFRIKSTHTSCIIVSFIGIRHAVMTFSLKTLNINTYFETFSIMSDYCCTDYAKCYKIGFTLSVFKLNVIILNLTEPNDRLLLFWLCWVSQLIYCYAECLYAEFHYGECCSAEYFYAEWHGAVSLL